jgi:fermentation-respiration switch protein FrsA (DUF1100 family)
MNSMATLSRSDTVLSDPRRHTFDAAGFHALAAAAPMIFTIQTDARLSSPRNPQLRLLFRAASLLVVTYLSVALLLSSFQTQLIFPGHATQGQAATRFEAPPGTELVSLVTKKGERIAALFGPALDVQGRPVGKPVERPTLLFFYGNAMCLKASLEEFELFRRLGLNVLIPDYLGYGMSDGKPGEAECYRTAEAAYEHLLTRRDVDAGRIIVGGWSLGAAVAVDVAAQRSVAGLILLSAFTSMSDAARTHLPYVPVSLLLRHRFESLRKIKKVTCSILIGHGSNDTLIPNQMSTKLRQAARSDVIEFRVARAGHNDFFMLGEAQLQHEVTRFVSKIDPRTP